ncbi:MAG TPA: GNAT family N-acetyltransferase, partial [Thermoplasmata archaeon]|nr:GNAT family N-acetyltransferase [Thermoplasmata archaeon]
AAAGGIGEPPVPTTVQRAVQDNGGLVVGAFAEIYLAGFALGFLGWDGEKLYLYSQRTAVRPEYQNHRLGYRLKTHQRDELLRQGLDEIRWTFDPLQSRNAFLFVHRLGAVPDKYLVHYYGRLGEEGADELETDRVRAVWKLQDPTVVARLEAKAPDRTADERRFAESTPLVETDLDEHGLRVPASVQEPALPSASLEIPFDLGLVREHSPKNLRTWRHAVRDAFRAAFDLGYSVDDFAVIAPEHERRSVYFLRRPAPPT